MRSKVIMILSAILLLPALTGKASQSGSVPTFTNPLAITNPYLPLGLLKQDILEGTEGRDDFRVERSFRAGTKVFKIGDQLVQTLIIEDRDFRNGKRTCQRLLWQRYL